MEDIKQVEEEQIVVFKIANEVCGIDISKVQEIIRMQPITEVPKAPEFVKGVINLRGKVIPVIDLRERFGFEASEDTKSTRIVVAEVGSDTAGMIVDAVAEVIRVPLTAIEPPSHVVEGLGSDYLRGIGKVDERLIILLNMEKILNNNEREYLSEYKEEPDRK
ncbi:MAG: chemotaxis protein CheW [Actinomycetota bacterium]|nr:chemotaxis protein CheW [Actinomycetota bacterium]